jgi:NTE family protein
MTRTALVLGAGGTGGGAWQIGLLAGLAAAGLDLTTADLVVGTSTGAVVAAQVATGSDLAELYAAQLADSRALRAATMRLGTLLRYAAITATTRDPQRMRARIGALAATATTPDPAERRAEVAAQLPGDAWPWRALRIAVVDAHTGQLVTLTRDSGVGLVDAVLASCAAPGAWPPVDIDGHLFIDGRVGSPINAELAEGYQRVAVLAPQWRGIGLTTSTTQQVRALRLAGAHVAVIAPDPAMVRAAGRAVLNPRRRRAAARSGYAQAARAAAMIAPVWLSAAVLP